MGVWQESGQRTDSSTACGHLLHAIAFSKKSCVYAHEHCRCTLILVEWQAIRKLLRTRSSVQGVSGPVAITRRLISVNAISGALP